MLLLTAWSSSFSSAGSSQGCSPWVRRRRKWVPNGTERMHRQGRGPRLAQDFRHPVLQAVRNTPTRGCFCSTFAIRDHTCLCFTSTVTLLFLACLGCVLKTLLHWWPPPNLFPLSLSPAFSLFFQLPELAADFTSSFFLWSMSYFNQPTLYDFMSYSPSSFIWFSFICAGKHN